MAFMRDFSDVMDLQDIPQWVIQNFIRAAKSAGANASDKQIEACCQVLVQDWQQKNRYHHDIRHLLDMLMRLDTLSSETSHPDYLRLACWFHGIVFSTANQDVYTRNGGEDEIASAYLAKEKMQDLGLPEDVISAVQNLIISLKTRPDTKSAITETGAFAAIDMDQMALRDAHLGSLAVEPQKYKKYLEELRKEYSHIPLGHFLTGRMEIVRRLLARQQLFISPLAEQWEDVARQNLTAELERLKIELENSPDLSLPTFITDDDKEKNITSPADSLARESSAASGKGAPIKLNAAGEIEVQAKEESTATLTLEVDGATAAVVNGALADVAATSAEGSTTKVAKNENLNTPERVLENADSEEEMRAEAEAAKEAETPRSSMENLDDDFSPRRPNTPGTGSTKISNRVLLGTSNSEVKSAASVTSVASSPAAGETMLETEKVGREVETEETTTDAEITVPELPKNDEDFNSKSVANEPIHAMEEAPDY